MSDEGFVRGIAMFMVLLIIIISFVYLYRNVLFPKIENKLG